MLLIKLEPDVWNIEALDDRRRRFLQESPEGLSIIESAVGEAQRHSSAISPRWQPSDENAGFYRARSRIPASPELFDLIFNGPAGYRAHYYFQPDTGEWFNNRLVRALVTVIERNHALMDLVHGPSVLKSLAGKWSKIWVTDDTTVFGEAPENQLRPERWVKNNKPGNMGLRAPYPLSPSIDLIGTWIHPHTGETWLPQEKEHRSFDLHMKGFV